MSPSYVNCVSNGVIMSTHRSRMIKQSSLSEGDVNVSGVEPMGARGKSRPRRTASRWTIWRKQDASKNVGTIGTHRSVVSLPNNAREEAIELLERQKRLC